MMNTWRPATWKVLAMLALFGGLLLVIVACGGEDEETAAPAAAPAPAPTQAAPQPTAAPATQAATQAAPAPRATQAPRATTAPSTAAPTMAPTAAPTATRQRFIPDVTTAAPTEAPGTTMMEPVQQQLRVSMSPPGVQATTMWKLAGWQSAQGPLCNLYEGMLHIDRFTEEWVGYLAESWSISNNAQDWHFKLKEGVPFYKNKQKTDYEFTVQDVIFSYKVNNFPPWQASFPGAVGPFSTLDEEHFEIISDHEFVWKLSKPNLTWGYWSTDDRRGVASEDYYEEVGEDAYIDDPIGTGPFTYVDFAINQGLKLERVEDHHRKTPAFHELQFFYVPEEATRTAMLYTNEAEIVSIARNLHEQAISRGYQVQNSTVPAFYTFMFIGGMFSATRPDGYGNCPPGNDVKPDENRMCPPGRYEVDEASPLRVKDVREAMNLAINREELNKTFFGDQGIPTTRWAFPPWWPHANPDWTPYPYDPERARELITGAGYPNGFDMELHVTPPLTGLPEIGETAEVIAQYFEQVGINVSLIPINTAQMTSKARNREHARGVHQTRFGPPTTGGLVNHFRNNVRWRQEWQQHDEIYDFVDQLEAVSDWDTLRAIEVEATEWARENHLIIPLFWVYGQVVINPNVVAAYEGRHLHMGPSRHHEYTVPVYK